MSPRLRPVLTLAVGAVLPLVFAFALHLLLVGHDEPGGGFAAGLLVAGALALDALAHPERSPRLHTEALIGGGLLLAVGVALAPLIAGQGFFEAARATVTIPGIAQVKLSTVLLFDIGVLLVVVGLARAVLDRVRVVLTSGSVS